MSHKIRIVKCSDPNLWYLNAINREYEVRECNSLSGYEGLNKKYSCLDFYKTDDLGNLILKSDCVNWEDYEVNEARVYDTGAKRDSDLYKPYVHNLKGYTRLRFGYLTRMGAQKYGDDNYLKGFPKEDSLASLDRHLARYMAGDRSEDHLASIIFNAQLVMLEEEKEGIKADHYFKIK